MKYQALVFEQNARNSSQDSDCKMDERGLNYSLAQLGIGPWSSGQMDHSPWTTGLKDTEPADQAWSTSSLDPWSQSPDIFSSRRSDLISCRPEETANLKPGSSPVQDLFNDTWSNGSSTEFQPWRNEKAGDIWLDEEKRERQESGLTSGSCGSCGSCISCSSFSDSPDYLGTIIQEGVLKWGDSGSESGSRNDKLLDSDQSSSEIWDHFADTWSQEVNKNRVSQFSPQPLPKPSTWNPPLESRDLLNPHLESNDLTNHEPETVFDPFRLNQQRVSPVFDNNYFNKHFLNAKLISNIDVQQRQGFQAYTSNKRCEFGRNEFNGFGRVEEQNVCNRGLENSRFNAGDNIGFSEEKEMFVARQLAGLSSPIAGRFEDQQVVYRNPNTSFETQEGVIRNPANRCGNQSGVYRNPNTSFDTRGSVLRPSSVVSMYGEKVGLLQDGAGRAKSWEEEPGFGNIQGGMNEMFSSQFLDSRASEQRNTIDNSLTNLMNLMSIMDSQEKNNILPPSFMEPPQMHLPPLGRAITGAKLTPSYPPPNISSFGNIYDETPFFKDLAMPFPINFKVPPPSHPPAVPHPSMVPPPTFSIPPPVPIINYPPPNHLPSRPNLAIELHMRLEEAYEQFRSVEKERKKTEAALARQFPGRKVSSSNSISIPGLLYNPTRVDKLVVDNQREHAKVATLVVRMEKLRGGVRFGEGVNTNLQAWYKAAVRVQDLRRKEVEAQSPYNRDDRALAFSLGSLAQATRGARTALWSALQATALMEVDHEVALGEKEPKDARALENMFIDKGEKEDEEGGKEKSEIKNEDEKVEKEENKK